MLYIFDLDGTLVASYESEPLPGVVERLAELTEAGHNLAVATNQAGVAWRAWTRREKFPSGSSLGSRFTVIATLIPALQSVPWLVAIHDTRVRLSQAEYDALAEEFINAAPTLALRVSTDPSWRKPAAGMLLAACLSYGIDPANAVFVGDADTDAEAADAAGVAFCRAAEFFSTPLSELKDHLQQSAMQSEPDTLKDV